MDFFLVSLVALAIIVLSAVRFFSGRIPAEPPAASDITALSITLDINEKPSVFIPLSEDGSINRMGTGTLENTERELFIGKTDPAIFEAVRSNVTEAMLQIRGRAFQHQNPRGAPCKLTLNFQFNDGAGGRVTLLYGSESEGVPKDVVDLVTVAVHETDPWYENFKRTAAGRPKP